MLTDANFASKVNPSRKYPACDINTSNLFDDEGDPIFNLDAQTSPNPATPTPSSSKPKTNKQNTGLKRTLCTSVQKKKRSKNQRAAADILPEQPIQPVPPTATVIAVIAPPTQQTQPTQTALPKPKPFRHPQLLALPSRIAIPIDPSYQQLLECSFLPVSGLKGNALFNAFLTFCSSNEQHAVLVSRAFVSQSVTLQGEMLAVRQVTLFPHVNNLYQKILRTNALRLPYFCSAGCISEDGYSCSVQT